MKFYRLLTFIVLIFSSLFVQKSYATHLRAGEITAKRISATSLTYEITVTTYHDEVGGRMASDSQNEIKLCIKPFGLGAGTVIVVKRSSRTRINNATSKNVFIATYVFPSPGRFVINCGIRNRNENVININNSKETAFYLETIIDINAALGLNRTPVLLNAPLDSARTGQKFCHNPAAFDADGDSLAYRMSIPKQGEEGTCVSQNTPYKDPALGLDPNAKNETQNAPATLTINPLTGDLCWDAPAVIGQYNVAFIIEEWRDGVKIGEIVRDMQIIVVEGAINKRPLLDPIKDVCIEAGQLMNQTIKATDPDGNKILISIFSGIFNVDVDGKTIEPSLIEKQYATYSPLIYQNTPATAQMKWQTNCAHVRDQPYEIVVKVEDQPARNVVSLASFTTFSIKVVAPKPKNLTIVDVSTASNRGFKLDWSLYACQTEGAQIVVFRKESCSNVKLDACAPNSTNPTALGYTEVTRLPINTITFTDDNKGFGFRRGVSYSYRIQVLFALPAGGSSVASDEACLDLPAQMPVITNVTVDSTSATKGVITVKWTKAQNLKEGDLPAPIQYRLFRATDLNGTAYTQVGTIPTDLKLTTKDTIFIDRNLNTTQNAYRYYLELYYTENGAFKKFDQTEAASSVFLTTAVTNQVQLTWQANVPWNNANQKHRVYREDRRRPNVFNIVAEVAVQGTNTFTYTDDGKDKFVADGDISVTIKPDSNYCYKVQTTGVYDSQRIKAGILYNMSQIVCANPVDNSKPCVPVLKLDTIDCSAITTDNCPDKATNNLNWTYPTKDAQGNGCASAATYKIFYVRYPDEKPALVGTVVAPNLTFKHTGLDSYAGCYYVTAVTRAGIESAASNVVCTDNCPVYKLPNVITPNGDGKNDTFRPISCTLAVSSVTTTIVNRYGTQVFESTDPLINWDGKTNDGKDLPTGTYYYQATVTFKRLSREDSTIKLKGWIQLLR
jgi:gliding motility-associated-like protein